MSKRVKTTRLRTNRIRDNKAIGGSLRLVIGARSRREDPEVSRVDGVQPSAL